VPRHKHTEPNGNTYRLVLLQMHPPHWTIGVSDVSSIFITQILSPMTWFGITWDNHSSQILFIDSTCLSVVTSVVPTPVKTIHN